MFDEVISIDDNGFCFSRVVDEVEFISFYLGCKFFGVDVVVGVVY